MLDRFVVIMAGLLLIIPGFISDVIGLLLLIAPLRRWLIRRAVGDVYDHPLIARRGPRAGPERPVIDATYERHDPNPERPRND